MRTRSKQTIGYNATVHFRVVHILQRANRLHTKARVSPSTWHVHKVRAYERASEQKPDMKN